MWSVELREVVSRILGVGGGESENRVGNLRAREVGVRSRFVLVVEAAIEPARGLWRGAFSFSESESASESESNMLSTSS